MTTAQLTMMSWTNQGTSIRFDVFCLAMAIAMHVPLMFMKFDARKKSTFDPKERLVAVDLIEPEAPKPVAPKPVVKKSGFMDRLKALMESKPKPPPPKPKKIAEPKKLATGPEKIKLEPKLKLPDKINPTLKSKSGFKTKANPKLVKEKQISLKSLGAGVAPLSAKKVGVVKDRSKLKSNKGNFQVSRNESLSGIEGSGPGLADPTAPTIALKTGRKGTTEKFSAAAPQKMNKGSFKGGSARLGGGSDAKLGLRDSVIARTQSKIDVGSSGGGKKGGVTGGVPGGTGTKRDAGRSFQAGSAGNSLGKVGGTGSLASTKKVAPIAATRPKKKKKMFTITGELKNRKIVRQVRPEYPGWAQAQGIEAQVVLEFTVNPAGKVKDSIVVRRTSGYPQLDKTAIQALKAWLFAPLGGDVYRDEIGLITFNYTLN